VERSPSERLVGTCSGEIDTRGQRPTGLGRLEASLEEAGPGSVLLAAVAVMFVCEWDG
jgi:hypothetical protein